MKQETRSRISAVLRNQELLLLILSAIILAAVIVKVPDFFSVQTLFNILRSSMVNIIFALAVMLVMVAGGIDVSFMAIGMFSAYWAVKFLPATSDSPLLALAAFGMAICIGILLGLVNAAIVIGSRVIVLIATLATSAIFMGVLFSTGGGVIINTLPPALQSVADFQIITMPGAIRGTTSLNVLIIPVIVICLLVWAFLKWTIPGRSIFAIGGNEVAAERAAVPVRKIRILVFVIAGALSAIAGVMSVTLAQRADPTAFMGQELNTIAAVVLGGAALQGGKGTVHGTILGVVLISLIQTSLVPLGVPSIWQQTVVGVLLIVGVGLQAINNLAKPKRPILEEI